MPHLWEPNHDYYCHPDEAGTFDSWAEFLEEWGESDKDYNLVFRWDWLPVEDEGTEDELPPRVRINIIHQRKDNVLCVLVKITPEEEPAVREYLEQKWKELSDLWAPIPSTSPHISEQDLKAHTVFIRCTQCHDMFVPEEVIDFNAGTMYPVWLRPKKKFKNRKLVCAHLGNVVETWNGDRWILQEATPDEKEKEA